MVCTYAPTSGKEYSAICVLCYIQVKQLAMKFQKDVKLLLHKPFVLDYCKMQGPRGAIEVALDFDGSNMALVACHRDELGECQLVSQRGVHLSACMRAAVYVCAH